MMTLEQERDHPQGATAGGEATQNVHARLTPTILTTQATLPSHANLPPTTLLPTDATQQNFSSPSSSQPILPGHHSPLMPHSPTSTTPQVSPKALKPGSHSRRARTPLRGQQGDGHTSRGAAQASDVSSWLGSRQVHRSKSQRSSQSQGHKSPQSQSQRSRPGQKTAISPGSKSNQSQSKGSKSPQGHSERIHQFVGLKHSLAMGGSVKPSPESMSRRGSESSLGQKQKKMACEVVVPSLPPPPDPRLQGRVPLLPMDHKSFPHAPHLKSVGRIPLVASSMESAEGVNLMDLSSNIEPGCGSVDAKAKTVQDGSSMEVDFSGVLSVNKTGSSPLASPTWVVNTIGSTYHKKNSPCEAAFTSRAPSATPYSGRPSSRKASPTVQHSPAVMDVTGAINTSDTTPLLTHAGDTSSEADDISIADGATTSNTTASGFPVSHKMEAVSPSASSAISVGSLKITEGASKGCRVKPLSLVTSPSVSSDPTHWAGDPSQRAGMTSPAPLSTPDLRVDMFDSDYHGEGGWLPGDADPAMEIGSPPAVPQGFPAITPEDLTPAELHEFDMKYGSPHHARSRSIKSLARPTLLALPMERPRMTSLPVNPDEEDDDYYRLRHFSISGRRIVNRGDSFKSRRTRSNNSVASDASR